MRGIPPIAGRRRYVVTQSRQAVGCQDPLQLAASLETLLGTVRKGSNLAAIGMFDKLTCAMRILEIVCP